MQIQESINAANFLSVGMNTSKKGSADDGALGTDFASFLKSSDMGQDKVKESVSPEKELFSKSDDVEVKKSDDLKKSSEKTSDNSNKAADDKVSGNKDKVDNSEKSDNAVKDNVKETAVDNKMSVTGEVDEAEIKNVIEAIGDILNFIMNKFDMTFEEIKDSVSQLGMEMDDLLSADGLKSFFLNVESADVSMLLTDESFKADYEAFVSEITDILEQDGVSFEEIEAVFEEELIVPEDIVPVKSDEKASDYEVVEDDTNTTVYSADESVEKVKVTIENNKADSNDHKEASHKNADKSVSTDNNSQNMIIQGINDALADVSESAPVSEVYQRPTEIVDQIVEQIRVNINQDNTSMEMQLYPEHLGRIQIHVVSKDGVMTARIAAETETAKQAIEAGLNNLKESLNNQNLKVEAIEVMVSTTAFAESDQSKEQYNGQEAGKRKGSSGFSDIDDAELEEEIETQKMQAEGSSVSYLA